MKAFVCGAHQGGVHEVPEAIPARDQVLAGWRPDTASIAPKIHLDPRR